MQTKTQTLTSHLTRTLLFFTLCFFAIPSHPHFSPPYFILHSKKYLKFHELQCLLRTVTVNFLRPFILYRICGVNLELFWIEITSIFLLFAMCRSFGDTLMSLPADMFDRLPRLRSLYVLPWQTHKKLNHTLWCVRQHCRWLWSY